MVSKRPLDWTRKEVLKLIELYETEPLLYDTTSPQYKNKSARLAALGRISDQFIGIKESVNVHEVLKKINTLRGQFSNELTKKKLSNNEKEEPYWFNRLRFVEKHVRPRPSSDPKQVIQLIVEEPPASDDSLLERPEPKRARISLPEEEPEELLIASDSRNDLLKMAIDALNNPPQFKYSQSVEAFGEFIKSQVALVPAGHQSILFQNMIDVMFKFKDSLSATISQNSFDIKHESISVSETEIEQ